jgi:hypothetical protein
MGDKEDPAGKSTCQFVKKACAASYAVKKNILDIKTAIMMPFFIVAAGVFLP